MRLFIFAVGGTGTRVLKSLIMLLATGTRPLDENGNPLKNLEIVPIIVDPHKTNEDLKRTENLLKWYREIRESVYEEQSPEKGFFSPKISTLKDILRNTDNTLSNTFAFNLGDVETKRFRDFISYNALDVSNQALCSLMFSKENLETQMHIGFVGSPNIGSVALNQFKDSVEFREFANVFTPDDRVFIISSIFGGTGAAGFPIIVKNIRNADRLASISNKDIIKNAKIGALVVLPYFNIAGNPNSPISKADFIIKTQSALYYYKENLTGNGSLNACYYLGDEIPSNPYTNDPGEKGQKNKAHLIEFIGASAIIDFMSISDKKLQTKHGVALNPLFYEYGLAKDKIDSLNLLDLGRQTRSIVNKNMAKFHLFYLFLENKFKDFIGRGFTQDKPEIRGGFLSTSFYRTLTDFLKLYIEWLEEMANNKRGFIPFSMGEKNIAMYIRGVEPQKSFFKGTVDYYTVLSKLNELSKKNLGTYADHQAAFKLFDLFNTVSDNLLDEKYNSII
jgi:hypothetical protein